MSKLVFRLASVSTEEADGVRAALDDIGVAYYETSRGVFGWSMPGIWIRNDDDYEAARQAIEEFQVSWVKQVRESGDSRPPPNYLKIAMALIASAIVLYLFNYAWAKILL